MPKHGEHIKAVHPAGCTNCEERCLVSKWCDGCESWLCDGCWAEHNEDAPCHLCGEYPKRDAEGNLTEDGCGC
jgi:hypothetical protein